MLSLTVKIGQVLQIGESTFVKLVHRSGQSARLVVDSDESPIKVLDGDMPSRPKRVEVPREFLAARPAVTYGITGEARPI